MAELIEESQALESTTVGIYRTATVVKGGRRFSFAALVVVGDGQGNIGIGYGKAPSVPPAIEKAQKEAKRSLKPVILKGGTIPHEVTGRCGAASVRLIPAAPGTGVIAGGTVRAVLEAAGVKDCLTKSLGSTNQKNLCKAAIAGLRALRSKEMVAELRNVEIEKTEAEEKLELGERFAPSVVVDEENRAKAPVNTVGQKDKGGRGGRGRGRGRGRDEQPQDEPPAQETPTAEAPAEESAPAAVEAPAAEAAPAPEAPAEAEEKKSENTDS